MSQWKIRAQRCFHLSVAFWVSGWSPHLGRACCCSSPSSSSLSPLPPHPPLSTDELGWMRMHTRERSNSYQILKPLWDEETISLKAHGEIIVQADLSVLVSWTVEIIVEITVTQNLFYLFRLHSSLGKFINNFSLRDKAKHRSPWGRSSCNSNANKDFLKT